jgi:hypothetical protein
MDTFATPLLGVRDDDDHIFFNIFSFCPFLIGAC